MAKEGRNAEGTEVRSGEVGMEGAEAQQHGGAKGRATNGRSDGATKGERRRWVVVLCLAAGAAALSLVVVGLDVWGWVTYSRVGWFAGVDSGDFIVGHDLACPPGLSDNGYEPYWRPPAGSLLLSAPLWPAKLAFLPPGALAMWWLWRRSSYQAPGLCHACGYDLSGLTGGVCPECGGES